jgi:hypothetical protein
MNWMSLFYHEQLGLNCQRGRQGNELVFALAFVADRDVVGSHPHHPVVLVRSLSCSKSFSMQHPQLRELSSVALLFAKFASATVMFCLNRCHLPARDCSLLHNPYCLSQTFKELDECRTAKHSFRDPHLPLTYDELLDMECIFARDYAV